MQTSPERNEATPGSRRSFLKTTLSTVGALAASAPRGVAAIEPVSKKPDQRTPASRFQIACMTLPWSQFSLARAFEGVAGAGFRYVAWGTTHTEADGADTPVLAVDAPPGRAKELAARSRDAGLEPVLMFSTVYPEHDGADKVLANRLRQAAAAKIPQVLTFGHTEGGNESLWIKRFKALAPLAADLGVMLVVKQHGGSTGTGEACAQIIREVGAPSIRVNYDAGNVMDYLNVDPLPDLEKCADVVHSFCIKDHRNHPKDEDCGPGLGEIDHYRLLEQVAFTGRTIPLACENIFAPLLPRPKDPRGVDALARRAREFLELVVAGLQT